MTAISLGWFEEEEPRDFVRRETAAAIVLASMQRPSPSISYRISRKRSAMTHPP